ncbi:hypothetical protein [Burkholderia pyrrocinia]
MPTIRPSSTVSTSLYRPSSSSLENGRLGQSQSGGNNAGFNTRSTDSGTGQHVPPSEFVVPHQYLTVEILNAQNGNGGGSPPASANGNSSPSSHQSVSTIESKFQNKSIAGFSGDAQSDGLHLADGKLYAEISGSDDAVLVAYDHDKKNIRAVLEGDTDVTGPTGPIFTRLDPEENVFTFDPKSAIDGNSNIPKNNVEISKNEDIDAISPAPDAPSNEANAHEYPDLSLLDGREVDLGSLGELQVRGDGISVDTIDRNKEYLQIDGKFYRTYEDDGDRFIHNGGDDRILVEKFGDIWVPLSRMSGLAGGGKDASPPVNVRRMDSLARAVHSFTNGQYGPGNPNPVVTAVGLQRDSNGQIKIAIGHNEQGPSQEKLDKERLKIVQDAIIGRKTPAAAAKELAPSSGLPYRPSEGHMKGVDRLTVDLQKLSDTYNGKNDSDPGARELGKNLRDLFGTKDAPNDPGINYYTKGKNSRGGTVHGEAAVIAGGVTGPIGVSKLSCGDCFDYANNNGRGDDLRGSHDERFPGWTDPGTNQKANNRPTNSRVQQHPEDSDSDADLDADPSQPPGNPSSGSSPAGNSPQDAQGSHAANGGRYGVPPPTDPTVQAAMRDMFRQNIKDKEDSRKQQKVADSEFEKSSSQRLLAGIHEHWARQQQRYGAEYTANQQKVQYDNQRVATIKAQETAQAAETNAQATINSMKRDADNDRARAIQARYPEVTVRVIDGRVTIGLPTTGSPSAIAASANPLAIGNPSSSGIAQNIPLFQASNVGQLGIFTPNGVHFFSPARVNGENVLIEWPSSAFSSAGKSSIPVRNDWRREEPFNFSPNQVYPEVTGMSNSEGKITMDFKLQGDKTTSVKIDIAPGSNLHIHGGSEIPRQDPAISP